MRERTLRWCLIFLCVLCNAAQVFQLCKTYFKYDISTKVSIEYPEYLRPPALNLCFYLLQVIDWDKAASLHPSGVASMGNMSQYSFRSLGNSAMQAYTSKFIAGLSSENLFKTVLRPEEIFKRMLFFSEKVQLQSLDFVNTKLFLDVIESFNTIYYCYTFKVKGGMEGSNEFQISNLKVNRAFLVSGLLYSVTMTEEATRRIGEVELGYIWHTDTPIAGYKKSVRTVVNNSVLTLTFSYFNSALLKWPYKTNCFDYSQFNGSRAVCHDKCAYHESTRLTPASPFIYPGIAVFKSMKGQIMPYDPQNSKFDVKSLDRIEKACARKCSNSECHRRIYVPQIESTIETDSNTTTLATFTCNMPPTSVQSIPSLGIWEFLTDIGSTFGFWLGISLLAVSSLIYRPEAGSNGNIINNNITMNNMINSGSGNNNNINNSHNRSGESAMRRRSLLERRKEARNNIETMWYSGQTGGVQWDIPKKNHLVTSGPILDTGAIGGGRHGGRGASGGLLACLFKSGG